MVDDVGRLLELAAYWQSRTIPGLRCSGMGARSLSVLQCGSGELGRRAPECCRHRKAVALVLERVFWRHRYYTHALCCSLVNWPGLRGIGHPVRPSQV
ncbi:hypothetical protein [Thermogemmatispora onikobensis]|uniref:hypothetical protein n=1 Tax=Thermogemmatispora sp. TaxID=1968838 RepID=UPI0008533237